MGTYLQTQRTLLLASKPQDQPHQVLVDNAKLTSLITACVTRVCPSGAARGRCGKRGESSAARSSTRSNASAIMKDELQALHGRRPQQDEI